VIYHISVIPLDHITYLIHIRLYEIYIHVYEMTSIRNMFMRDVPMRDTPMRWHYEKYAYERRSYERYPYEGYAYEMTDGRRAYKMAYGRDTPMRDKPMR
jgi:hypothetical protein